MAWQLADSLTATYTTCWFLYKFAVVRHIFGHYLACKKWFKRWVTFHVANERNYDRLDQTMFCYGLYDAMGMCTKENQMVINNVKQFELVKRNGNMWDFVNVSLLPFQRRHKCFHPNCCQWQLTGVLTKLFQLFFRIRHPSTILYKDLLSHP